MSDVIPQQSDNDGLQPQLLFKTGHATRILDIFFLPDERRVITGSYDGTLMVWDLGNGEREGSSMDHRNPMWDFAMTRDGSKIISAGVSGVVKVWDVEARNLFTKWNHPDEYISLAISPDDQLVAVYHQIVAIYTMEGTQVNNTIEVGEAITTLRFSPDGSKLACTSGTAIATRHDHDSNPYDVRVYDVESGTLLLGPFECHEDVVYSILWSRDGSKIFTASSDQTICCWNSVTGKLIGRPMMGHTKEIYSLSLSPDGSILASTSADNTIRFWDATSGHPVGQHGKHDHVVKAACFSPCGESIASIDWDRKIYLWRVPWLNSIKDQVTTPFAFTSTSIHPLQLPQNERSDRSPFVSNYLLGLSIDDH